MQKKFTRILSAILCVLMLASILPTAAFAAEEADKEAAVEYAAVSETQQPEESAFTAEASVEEVKLLLNEENTEKFNNYLGELTDEQFVELYNYLKALQDEEGVALFEKFVAALNDTQKLRIPNDEPSATEKEPEVIPENAAEELPAAVPEKDTYENLLTSGNVDNTKGLNVVFDEAKTQDITQEGATEKSYYYNIISQKDYTLVPNAAVESEIVINNTNGDRRQVMHVIQVDPSNTAVSVLPGYYGIDKDLTDINNHRAAGVSELADYYENNLGYNVVGAMNTGLAYDNNAPYSYLVYNGEVLVDHNNNINDLHNGACQTILCVYKNPDGTCYCELRTSSQGLRGDEWQAIGANFAMTINDGKLVTTAASRGDAAARSMVGIKEDGTLVLCMNDGRGVNNSVGFGNYELGEAMLALGCKWAFNCDGGGSSSFVSKRVGENTTTMRSVPCDGAERPTLNSVVIVSNVGKSDILDTVNIESDYDYFAPGSTYTFGAKATDTHGYAMDMPADVAWRLSDEAFGTIENGCFASNGTIGEVTVQIVSGGEVVGTKLIHVANPTTLSLSADSTVLPYSTEDKVRTLTIPIVSMIGEANVYYDANVFEIMSSVPEAGTLDGFTFTATNDETVSGTVISAKYRPTEITLTYKIDFGRGSTVLYDFEDGDISEWAGTDEAEAWLRANGVTTSGNDTWSTAFKTLLNAGQISWSVKTSTFLSTVENGGQVHNGSNALGINFDMRNTEFNEWVYILVWNIKGNTVLRDVANGQKATQLGMWLYLPNGFRTEKNAGSTAWQLTVLKGADADNLTGTQIHFQYNGKNINALTESDIPENRWIYVTAKLDNQGDYVKLVDPLNDVYRAPSFIRGYVKPSEAQVLTYYMDDITLDYSSAVDDRNPPVISNATYCVSDTNIALSDQTISSNIVSFNASVSDFSASNAEGVNYASAAIYLDGINLNGVKVSGTSMGVENVELSDGPHTIKFEIEDNIGNVSTLTKKFTVNAAKSSVLNVVGHNDSGKAPEASSVYYVDLVASHIENVKSVQTTLYLRTANTWELNHMIVANGFEADYSVNPCEPNRVTITITKTGDVKATDEQTLVSIPVRVWSYDESTWVGGDSASAPKQMTTAQRYSSHGEPVLLVEANVESGKVTLDDDTTATFSGSINEATAVTGNKTAAWHMHSAAPVADKAPTCTEAGYTGRTYCDECASIVNWGTAVSATGHNFELVDGIVKCTNDGCTETFTGTWTDGKDYVNGVKPSNGWNGKYYYVDGVKYVGVKAIDGVYYNFGDDGISRGKNTGLFEQDGSTYYTIAGVLVSGWQDIDGAHYYFDKETYKGINGTYSSYEVCSTSHNFTMSFTNGKLDSGVWSSDANGMRYYYGETYYHNTTVQIDGKTYGFNNQGYRYEGICVIRWNPHSNYQLFEYSSTGEYIGELHENGVYTTTDGSVYYLTDGIASTPGLVQQDGKYYYFSSSAITAVANASCYVSVTNDLMPAGYYWFNADATMVIKQGIIIDDDGEIRYYVDNVATYAGLVQDDDGAYYYISGSSCTAVKNCTRYITKTNDLLPVGTYEFGEDGKMIIKKGIVTDADGEIRYYVDGTAIYAGLVRDTDGAYYYISGNGGMAVRNCTRYITKTNDLLPAGTYEFGEDGKLIIKQGIVVDADGETRYYVDGVATYAGLVRDADGAYYYISGNGGKAVKNCTRYITKTNDLLPAGTYEFGEDGKMLLKQGVIVDADGETRYYVDGVATYAGLVSDTDGAYYYISGNGCKAVKNSTRYVSMTNGLLPAGIYTFGSDGKMITG